MKTRKGADIWALLRDAIELLTPPPKELPSASIGRTLRVKVKGNKWVPFSTNIVPYMEEPVNLLNSSKYTKLIFMGCARTGKSQALVLGFAALCIAVYFQDLLIIHLTEDKALEFSRKELRPTIKNSPMLRDALTQNEYDFNLIDITFKSSSVVLVRWPSKNHLASTTVQNVVLTDYDRMPPNVDGEGSAFTLASKRTTTFGRNAMAVAESSPGHRVTDIDQDLEPHDSYDCVGIASLYNTGDKRCYYTQCLFCKEWFWCNPDTIWWNKELSDKEAQVKSARCQCPHCKGLHTNDELHRILIPNGQWLRKGEYLDKEGNKHGEGIDTTIASYWLRAPVCAFYSLQDIVRDWINAEEYYQKTGDEGPLQSFTNTTLGDPYIEKSRLVKNDAEELKKNIDKSYSMGEVPAGVTCLVATVDVQGGNNGRFEVGIFGFDRIGNLYLVDRFSIRSINNRPIKPDEIKEDWDVLLDLVLNYKAIIPNTNKLLSVAAMLIDSGGLNHTSENAYSFIRRNGERITHMNKKVSLVKGEARTKEVVRNGGKGKALMLVSTDYIKDVLANKLAVPIDQVGSLHLAKDVPRAVLKELSSEVPKNKGGKIIWEKISDKVRNETWDLAVYFLAFLFRYRILDLFDRDEDLSEHPSFTPIAYNPYVSEKTQEDEEKLYHLSEIRVTFEKERRRLDIEAQIRREAYINKKYKGD